MVVNVFLMSVSECVYNLCSFYSFVSRHFSGWTSGEASSKGLSNILCCSVPGQGISGLLRYGVLPLPFCLFSFLELS